eukprot:3566580-Rhodomonas_salina.2
MHACIRTQPPPVAHGTQRICLSCQITIARSASKREKCTDSEEEEDANDRRTGIDLGSSARGQQGGALEGGRTAINLA